MKTENGINPAWNELYHYINITLIYINIMSKCNKSILRSGFDF